VVALPCDVGRSGESAPSAFATAFKAMASVLERGGSSTEHRRRAAAQAVAAVCVKGMVGARASADRTLADELREACVNVASRMAGRDKVHPTTQKTCARHLEQDC